MEQYQTPDLYFVDRVEDIHTKRVWCFKEDHWHFVGRLSEDEQLIPRLSHINMDCSDECTGEVGQQLKKLSDWETKVATLDTEKIIKENYPQVEDE